MLGGGYSDNSHIRWFGVQNLDFQYFGGFQKMNTFLGYEDFVDIVLGSLQNWTGCRGHYCAFSVFS